MGFRLRDASTSDLPRLQEVFRLASLSNEDDRAVLLDHPEALVFPASLSTRRVRVATVDPNVVVGFATTVPAPDGLELAAQAMTRGRFTFALPPGTYTLVATTGGAKERQTVSLTAGRTVHENIVVPIS